MDKLRLILPRHVHDRRRGRRWGRGAQPRVRARFLAGESTRYDPPPYEYGNLPANEQRVVDGAIDGTRYTLDRSSPIPGGARPSFSEQEVVVRKGDAYYVFTYRVMVVWTETAGLAAIALILGGFAAVGEAIRRQQFPNERYPWQTG